MKTYQSGTKESKRGFFRRHKNAIIAVASLIAVVTVVTLSVVFSMPDSEPVSVSPTDPPAIAVEPKTVLPMTGAQVGLDYANDSLKWWDTLEVWKTHPGVDFVGEGSVVSIRDGIVADVENTTLEGTVVTVTHDGGYVSVYKSLANVCVETGAVVKAGDKLGEAASSMSELNTGAHVHLEVKQNGKYVDPSSLLPLNSDK